jgi:predicted dehydrogenase
MFFAQKKNLLLEWKNPETGVRVKPYQVYELGEIEEQYITYPRNFAVIWQYWKRLGTRAIVKKIISRLQERKRNRKIYGCGYGVIVEGAVACPIPEGARVFFFLYNHAPDEEIYCIDHRFIIETGDSVADVVEKKPESDVMPASFSRYTGWSPYSGYVPDADELRAELISLSTGYRNTNQCPPGSSACCLKGIDRRDCPSQEGSGRPSAVLFGLGNYSKIQIIPNIEKYLDLRCVHEIDPLQLDHLLSKEISLDTSPVPREDEKYDVWLVAGYHHTHADIAIYAINSGGTAVVEKPLVTTQNQYDSLIHALDTISDARFFTCFQKRYSPFNKYVFEDMGIRPGDPLDMHGIVYEIPLPKYHWYNWPNSGSRIISNGCHWLDYFMYLNQYAEVSSYSVKILRDNDLLVDVLLENGAILTMVLTDKGSQRLGVRENLELRANGTTITIVDACSYTAENRFRVIRTSRTNIMNVYKDMYHSICYSILHGRAGDSIESLRSTKLMLDIESQLKGYEHA